MVCGSMCNDIANMYSHESDGLPCGSQYSSWHKTRLVSPKGSSDICSPYLESVWSIIHVYINHLEYGSVFFKSAGDNCETYLQITHVQAGKCKQTWQFCKKTWQLWKPFPESLMHPPEIRKHIRNPSLQRPRFVEGFPNSPCTCQGRAASWCMLGCYWKAG